MNSLYLLLVPGSLAGLLVWAGVVRLIILVTGISSTTNPARTVRMSDQKQLFLLGTLVGIWLLVFASLTFYAHGHAESPGWSWFFGGVAAAPAANLLIVIATWLRVRRLNSATE